MFHKSGPAGRPPAIACVLAALFCLAGVAADPAPAQPAKDSVEAARLLSALEVQPLAAIYTPDILKLPERFSKTNLSAMLHDPAYAKGLETLENILAKGIGADLKKVWPEFSQQLAGPAVLAIMPRETDKPGEEGLFQLVFAVVVKDAAAGAKLRQLWPNVPPQADNLLAALALKTVAVSKLPDPAALPPWAVAMTARQADLGVSVQPRKLGAEIKAFAQQVGAEDDFASGLPLLAQLSESGLEHVLLWTTMQGENFNEEMQVRLAPDEQGRNTVSHVAHALKERPGKWDSLLAAMPGGEDALLLLQLDPGGLGADLPCAAQAMEHFLRGRRWRRTHGKEPASLAADRFKFLFDHLQGAVGIGAHPALSGELRLCVTAALKDDAGFRDVLARGLAGVGAEFETLNNARKIGGVAPLGAAFPGRGLFTAPIIGLSPGWLWLCSNSSSYQDLTTAFKTRKTLAAELQKEKIKDAERRAPEWREGDAARVQVEMERVVRLGYSMWLLSRDVSPTLLGWKIPADMLPLPAIFTNRMGLLRLGVRREGDTLEAYSHAVLPGTPLLAVAILQSAVGEIERARELAAEALEGP